MTDQWTLAALKEHFETLFGAHVESHKAVHQQEGLARDEAAEKVNHRLEGLNELRSEVITDRARFVSKEAFEAKIEAQNSLIAANRDQIAEWKGTGKGLSMSASILLGAATFISTLVAIFLAVS